MIYPLTDEQIVRHSEWAVSRYADLRNLVRRPGSGDPAYAARGKSLVLAIPTDLFPIGSYVVYCSWSHEGGSAAYLLHSLQGRIGKITSYSEDVKDSEIVLYGDEQGVKDKIRVTVDWYLNSSSPQIYYRNFIHRNWNHVAIHYTNLIANAFLLDLDDDYVALQAISSLGVS